jgi:hypothetical protein
MEQNSITLLLRDKATEPTNSVLENALGSTIFEVYQQLLLTASETYQMEATWRFYNDGKAWLCKLTHGKKTICWLSVYQQMFQLSFFFTDKTVPGVMQLEIDPKIKELLLEAKPVGKLIPLVVAVDRRTQLKDLEVLIAFKKKLK